MRRARIPALMLILLLTSARVLAQSPSAADLDFFERHVRPVLVEHCISCHGPEKQRSGLRVDSRAALLKGGDNGSALVPGEPDASPLIQAVRQTGMLKMPPKSKLKSEAIDALAAWVKRGAPWPELRTNTEDASAWKRHWAFQPIKNPAPPPVKDAGWPRNPIDRFILAKLEAKGLTPSPAADPRTLIRRLYFDLIGLPPTPEEVEQFARECGADCQSARLDGRIDNLPHGAVEKLIDRLLATPHYGERWGRYWLDVARYADTKGYVFFEEANYPWSYTYRDYVIYAFNEDLPYDQFILHQLAADQLGPGLERRQLAAMGFLTLGGRFMNNEHDILDDRIDVVTRGLLGLTVSCARCHDHKFDPIPAQDYYALYGVFASSVEPLVRPPAVEPPKTGDYLLFAQELEFREKKLTDFLNAKHAAVVSGAKTRVAEYLLAAQAGIDRPRMDDFMLIADGNDLNPTMLTRWQAYLIRTRKGHHRVLAPWHAFAAVPEKDFASGAAHVMTNFAARPLNPRVREAFTSAPISLAEVAKRYGELLNHGEKLGPTPRDPAVDELRQVFHGPDAPPNVARELFGELALLPDRPSQGQLRTFRTAVETWQTRGLGAPPRAMVLVDTPTPYQPHIFLRGNPNNLGEAVPRRFLAVLTGENPRSFQRGSGRLELAQAIADRANPLTARVLVNRIWMHHFGTGLVRTPSDFGLRGEPPTHPELLDHLATYFMDNGWSLKKLHRLLVVSRAYQQGSDDRPDCLPLDPENTLVWKMNRRRLDFEALRDALLAVSGRLDHRIGGPSTRDTVAAGPARRTLYGFLDRLNLPGLYRTFDFPMPDATSPRRDTTTVPPQALFLMNHPFVHESARRVAQRPELFTEKEPTAGVHRLYHLLYGRPPTAPELRLALEFLGQGEPAAWERYAHALLVANEFAFVD